MDEQLAEKIAGKTREFEAAGLCQWLYRCPYCIEGYIPIRSSVSEAMVHPDTPIGRVLCEPRTRPVDFYPRKERSHE